MDLRGAAQDVALFYTLGRQLGWGRRWPGWKEGSEFSAIRAQTASERR
jgi:Zn-dependent M28 family amino/carboxypeptidase